MSLVSLTAQVQERVLATVHGLPRPPSKTSLAIPCSEALTKLPGVPVHAETAIHDHVGLRDLVFLQADQNGDSALNTAEEALAAATLWQKIEVNWNKQWMRSDPERQQAVAEDTRLRSSTPRAQWPHILTAAELSIPAVIKGFELYFKHPPHAADWCGWKAPEVRSLTVGSISTRDDGQAMHFFTHTGVDGKRFLLKLGRYVDMKREALLTTRLARCGSSSFAKTCGFYRMPTELQDSGGLWRRWAWRTGQKFPLRQALIPIDIETDDNGRLGECGDCVYHKLDSKGTYLKNGGFRAHIELCPRHCVVIQVLSVMMSIFMWGNLRSRALLTTTPSHCNGSVNHNPNWGTFRSRRG